MHGGRGGSKFFLAVFAATCVAAASMASPGDALGARPANDEPERPAPLAIEQTFDAGGTPYAASQCLAPPGPETIAGGPWGNFLRLATTEVPNQNAVAFDRVLDSGYRLLAADFDLRVTPTPQGRADGLAFALLDAGAFGANGAVCPTLTAEEPNYAGSLGVGFDVYRNDEYGDEGNVVVSEHFSNSISVHFDGRVIAQVDASPFVDLAGGDWIHARVLVRPGDGFSTVSVVLTPYGGAPRTAVADLRVDGMPAYAARPAFAARSGGESADFDLDNVRVVALERRSASLFSLASPWAFAGEETSSAELVVARAGDAGAAASVRWTTEDGTASSGADYRERSGTILFAPGERAKRVRVKLVDDADREGDETFRVRLTGASGANGIAGPEFADVKVSDDETAREVGRWSAPVWMPIVPVHAALLPTAKLLYWDRFGECRIWDAATLADVEAPRPDFNAFCAGQSFLADGKLLVTGGHLHHGEPEHDGVGIPDAAVYDAVENRWTRVPNMTGGRWYPTNTALANGDTLVTSGSVDEETEPNTLPQIWLQDVGWRDLEGGRERDPYGVDLYPRMFLAPDGRAFKAGPDRDSWFLDTSGAGSWSRGPLANYARPRTYGPATMYAPGKILVAGGGNPPTATAEVIDLNEAAPAWRAVAPMRFARRHSNLTPLPDGTLVATGGTSGPGQNNQATPVFAAERWDPATEVWELLAAARAPRLYHSVALLLPDGRLLSGGGGQGGNATSFYNNAEIYSPAYLFKGPRPTIRRAPAEVAYGEAFDLRTPDAARIARVTLVRLPSVTHAFDQNQRFLELEFERAAGGLRATAPARPNDCPAGHYMLFAVSDEGVPSLARIVAIR